PGGEAPALDVQVRGSDYGAAAGAQIAVVTSSATDPAPRPMGAALAGPDGSARVILPPLPAGAYKATVTAKRADGSAVGEAQNARIVTGGSRTCAKRSSLHSPPLSQPFLRRRSTPARRIWKGGAGCWAPSGSTATPCPISPPRTIRSPIRRASRAWAFRLPG